ncbi:ABC transporter permease [Cohnella yongneupensis]|uniref:ABC transporter permease n=1 Tax=Cohnella yongneupensis TaxID=425006 RepID=A0ABW0R6K2_9BACL
MGNKTLRAIGLPVATLVVFIGIWQLYCYLSGIEEFTLPAPSDIAARMADDRALLWMHFTATLKLSLMGLSLGLAIGVLLAGIIHTVPLMREAVAPLLVISQNVPLIALGPLLMIWYGFGLTPKLILLVIVCFFPVTLSMLTGLGQAEPHLREYLGMIGASRWERLKRLEFPASLPYLFSGLKIAATYVVTSAIVAEWLGANKGIGYYLQLKFHGFDTPAVFGSIVCIVTLSLAFFGSVALLERLVIRWRPRDRQGWKAVSK